MDMMKMLGKLQESQKNIEETKARLANETIEAASNDQLLKVTVTKSGNVKDLQIAPELLEDAEQLEDYLVMTLNKALDQARVVYEGELAKAAKQGLPNIPGMPF